MTIHVILGDDHPALVAGVAHVLSTVSTIKVVGTARDSTGIVEQLERSPCDVLVTDYSMPGGKYGDGLAFIGFLRRQYPKLKIIVFTMIDNSALVSEIEKLGVSSVVNKGGDIDGLVSAISTVYSGGTYFPAVDPAKQLQSDVDRKNGRPKLSKRETEIVHLIASGLSVSEISEKLHRTKQTISSQKISAMRKLGIERDVELFRFAYETGLMGASQAPAFEPDQGESDA
jgi:two-component system, NarL family, captular synthesis response regulator RcsB